MIVVAAAPQDNKTDGSASSLAALALELSIDPDHQRIETVDGTGAVGQLSSQRATSFCT